MYTLSFPLNSKIKKEMIYFLEILIQIKNKT